MHAKARGKKSIGADGHVGATTQFAPKVKNEKLPPLNNSKS